MKLIDKYLYEVGKNLPYKNRRDIKIELKSLLLDDIENKFGNNPTEKEIKSVISSFGSPKEVAKRYFGDNYVINPQFTDLYFLIISVMVFAFTIAFSVVFFVQLFTDNLTSVEILKSLGKIPLNIITASFSGVGSVTLVFILLSRFFKNHSIDDDWNPDELKHVKLDDEGESKVESIFTIFFLVAFIGIINYFPQIISYSEELFLKSQIMIGHRINIDIFTKYAIFISTLWIFEMVYHILILKVGSKTRNLRLMNIILSILNISLFIVMISDTNLYLNYTNLIGYKAIFLIILIVTSIETITDTFKFIFRNNY